MSYNYYGGYPAHPTSRYNMPSYGNAQPSLLYHRQPPSATNSTQGGYQGGGASNIEGDHPTEGIDEEALMQELAAHPFALSGHVSAQPMSSLFSPEDMHIRSTYPGQSPMFNMNNAYQLANPGNPGFLNEENMDMHNGDSDGSEYNYDDDFPQDLTTFPSAEQTERYLRWNLNIPDGLPVNLWALPNAPWGNRQPGIAEMIKLAIWGSAAKRLTLRQIYDEVATRFPHMEQMEDKPWQRSIRHSLSLKAVFVNQPRPVNHPGKGNYWVLDVRWGEENKRSRKRRSENQADLDGREYAEQILPYQSNIGHTSNTNRPRMSSVGDMFRITPENHPNLRWDQTPQSMPQGYMQGPNPSGGRLQYPPSQNSNAQSYQVHRRQMVSAPGDPRELSPNTHRLATAPAGQQTTQSLMNLSLSHPQRPSRRHHRPDGPPEGLDDYQREKH